MSAKAYEELARYRQAKVAAARSSKNLRIASANSTSKQGHNASNSNPNSNASTNIHLASLKLVLEPLRRIVLQPLRASLEISLRHCNLDMDTFEQVLQLLCAVIGGILAHIEYGS